MASSPAACCVPAPAQKQPVRPLARCARARLASLTHQAPQQPPARQTHVSCSAPRVHAHPTQTLPRRAASRTGASARLPLRARADRVRSLHSHPHVRPRPRWHRASAARAARASAGRRRVGRRSQAVRRNARGSRVPRREQARRMALAPSRRPSDFLLLLRRHAPLPGSRWLLSDDLCRLPGHRVED